MQPHELDELNSLTDSSVWEPLPGPQSEAYYSEADVIGYGGAAGGGKTDLACGMALTKHSTAAIFRREGVQLTGVIDRLTTILGSREGYNGQDRIWRLEGRQIEFGSTQHPGDETKYQGRPKDLLVIDEAANFLESQVRFLKGWVRTVIPGQKCTTLLTFNPPTSAEGQWVIAYFAPWLSDKHPNPAKPGELRWFAVVDGVDVEVPDSRPFVMVGARREYDFNPDDYEAEDVCTPESRTFIPSRVSDNPFLVGTGYMRQLQAMPEPLRSQMLKGDFMAGVEDDPWQLIPTAWVDAAMARWKPREKRGEMHSMGVDVARGGRDKTVIARRHGVWFAPLQRFDGEKTKDGPAVFAETMRLRRDRAPVHIDIIGVGSSPYDFLKQNKVQTVGVNNSSASFGVTAGEAKLQFFNLRAEIMWRVREALDPENPLAYALPPDPRLKADLCAPRWEYRGGKVKVESKDEIKARIGRSPDDGDAVGLALIETLKDEADPRNVRRVIRDYDPETRSARQPAGQVKRDFDALTRGGR